ncbi:hypothetical protein BDP27DRAFT_1426588 [Rhodocollybia butyracea]|uniref:Uncharacterized protein n=1 Tax=Rhodocollybia butyracea TaxID=206335 RepID=A0A9P5PID0_9AGAR|nr:hypothetical protein BDP27DRAFT_1426588 [Rhodocollybia butyracea]
MRSALLFMLIVSSILVVCPLPMNEPAFSSQIQPWDGSDVLTVSFLDAQGGRDSAPTMFPHSKSDYRSMVDTAITAALNMKDAEIMYYGIFEPPEQNKFVYFEVIGGQKCHDSCFGWIAEGAYNDPTHGWIKSKRKMYYTGISLGKAGRNQFKPAHQCVGVNPPLALTKEALKVKWDTFRSVAHSLFMVPSAVPSTGASLAPKLPLKITSKARAIKICLTFMTLQNGVSPPRKPRPTSNKEFQDTLTKVILNAFDTKCSIIYYGSPVVWNADQHQRVYFKFTGGNFGKAICTAKEPCFGWTGLGPSIPYGQRKANPGDKFSRRYLAIYQHESLGTAEYTLLTVYPAVDGIDSPTSLAFLDMTKYGEAEGHAMPPSTLSSYSDMNGAHAPDWYYAGNGYAIRGYWGSSELSDFVEEEVVPPLTPIEGRVRAPNGRGEREDKLRLKLSKGLMQYIIHWSTFDAAGEKDTA